MALNDNSVVETKVENKALDFTWVNRTSKVPVKIHTLDCLAEGTVIVFQELTNEVKNWAISEMSARKDDILADDLLQARCVLAINGVPTRTEGRVFTEIKEVMESVPSKDWQFFTSVFRSICYIDKELQDAAAKKALELMK
jgi:hypothetical protein